MLLVLWPTLIRAFPATIKIAAELVPRLPQMLCTLGALACTGDKLGLADAPMPSQQDKGRQACYTLVLKPSN